MLFLLGTGIKIFCSWLFFFVCSFCLFVSFCLCPKIQILIGSVQSDRLSEDSIMAFVDLFLFVRLSTSSEGTKEVSEQKLLQIVEFCSNKK